MRRRASIISVLVLATALLLATRLSSQLGDGAGLALAADLPAGAPATPRPELLLQIGHRSGVMCMAISPDGQRAATGGSDGAAWLWDLTTGRQLAMFHGTNAHTEAEVNSVAFTPDGRHLLMTYAGEPELWELGSGARVQVFPAKASASYGSAMLSPDGQYLLIGASPLAQHSGRVTLWDASKAELLHTFVDKADVLSVAFSSDSRRAAYGLQNGTIGVYDCASGEAITTLELPEAKGGPIYSLPIAFHPDGKHLLAGSQTVAVFDLETGQRERQIQIGKPEKTLALDISPDGRRLIVGTESKEFRLVDYASGRTLATLASPTS